MAKWGEGDPRWIVEERPDATNVNNWHWSEKNASDWSKIKIKELLLELKLKAPDLGNIEFKDIKCNGEATANNRKGKLIFFYEWVVTLDWSGCVEDDEKSKASGSIEIPNLSEENEPHEIVVNVTVKSGGEVGERYKEYLRKEGANEIRKKIEEYLTALRLEYSSDLILPTKGSTVNTTTGKSRTITSSQAKSSNATVNSTSSNIKNLSIGCKLETKQISFRKKFKCRAEELYNALTIREMVCAFTRNEVKIEAVKGGKFELFGGNIEGNFIELVPGKKIVKNWRFKSWPSGHFSTVTIDIEEKSDCTEISFSQTQVPSQDLDRTRDGWETYYWESLNRTFGFGAVLI